MRKYRNVPVDGYASKKERDFALVLKDLAKKGVIRDLKEQVKFWIIPPNHKRGLAYIADFTYINSTGNLVAVDAKGYQTKEYRIKNKLMSYFNGIEIKHDIEELEKG